jgi:hypothetical protein
MSITSRLAALSVASIVLAACGGGAVKVQPPYVGSYDPGMLRYAISRGAILTEVVGNPFDAPKEEVDAAVTRSMTGATFGRMARFTTKVSPGYVSPYRVVVLLDPARGAQANRLCSDPGQPTAAWPDRIRAMAAFCGSDKAITSIAGSTAKTQGPGDPAFSELIRRMTLDLFPIQDPIADDEGIQVWPP